MADFADEIREDIGAGIGKLIGNGSSKSATNIFDNDDDDAFKNFDNSFISPGGPGHHIVSSSFCKKILYVPVCPGSTVRAWDVMLALPSLAFMAFLALRCAATNRKLRATNSPIFRAFHVLVAFNTALAIVRAFVSMVVAGAADAGEASATVAEKLLWIGLRFSLLATEMSVLVFGVAGGRLDTKGSIRRVVAVSAVVSFFFSSSQCLFEFKDPDTAFTVHDRAGAAFKLFGHGGSAFWMTSSACFALLYLAVLVLPIMPCTKKSLALPNKASFYQYCGLLFFVNTLQAFGCGLIQFAADPAGLCLVNMTTFAYVAFYMPVVYLAFLGPFFKTAQPTLLFSYKAQVDDVDDDETANNSGSLQFSLTPGATGAGDEENQPIVRNGDAVDAALSSLSAIPESLASPDSVVNGQFDDVKFY